MRFIVSEVRELREGEAKPYKVVAGTYSAAVFGKDRMTFVKSLFEVSEMKEREVVLRMYG